MTIHEALRIKVATGRKLDSTLWLLRKAGLDWKVVNAGVSGTPTSFFVLSDTISSTAADYVANALIQYKIPTDMLYVSDDKKTIAMSGALPKGLITGIIDSLLK